MELPTIITSDTTQPPDESSHSTHHHRHHHHHHHHHLTKHTGKGADAPGKRVLIGVDGSEHSSYACDWFFEHLWNHDDYVVLVNCPDLSEVVKSTWTGGKYVFDRELVDQKLKEGEEQIHHELEKYRDKLLLKGAHGKIKAVSAKSPGDAIVRSSEEESCDMIVIGCRGRSTLRRTILGTVSDYIVHHSSVPVVVCRRKANRKSSSSNHPNQEELLKPQQ